MFFGVACVAEDKSPPLTRCWRELESLFMRDPAFDDGVFVQSWILVDFPIGPERQTALDYFAQFLSGTHGAERWQQFVEAARKSRLGLYQDVGRTKKAAKFRELFTGRELSVLPSIDEYGKGEIFLTRMMTAGDQIFMFGNRKGFPRASANMLRTIPASAATTTSCFVARSATYPSGSRPATRSPRARRAARASARRSPIRRRFRDHARDARRIGACRSRSGRPRERAYGVGM